ncbi:MAG: stage III sporulation protein AG [Dethiobacteria bacterium]
MSGRKVKGSILVYLNDLWKGGMEGKNKNYILLVLLILGIILMFSSTFLGSSPKTAPSQSQPELIAETSTRSYEKELAGSLQGVLEQIEGISKAEVFINFDTSEESFFAQVHEESSRETTESDSEGGTREINETTYRQDYVLLRDGNGSEKPLLLSENKPRISGILVVAKGLESGPVRLEVIRAIQSLLNLPAHRIAVLPLGAE